MGFSFVSDTDELQFSFKTFGDTLNHIVEESSVKAVEGAMTTLVGRTFDNEFAVFYFASDIRIKFLAQFATGTFNGNDVGFFIHLDFYAFREGDG